VNVAAVVVTHGPAPELQECLDSLLPQVAELVVVANLPDTTPPLPEGARLVVREQPHGFAANVNRGIAETSAPFILVANPDTLAHPDVVELLLRVAWDRPRAGIVGPQLLYADGSWQPSRRRFPTVSWTLVRRTPLRYILRPLDRQREHYMLDERPSGPEPADWLLGAFLLLRREMLEELGGLDEGFRLYGEDIDLCYRASKAGWERWYVPQAIVRHRYDALIDRRFLTRRTLWHWRGILRFVRKHPERLRAL
jgi:N-acetylglucosaminyl-diphospho-decaprenol L-rhamnosyltransferase